MRENRACFIESSDKLCWLSAAALGSFLGACDDNTNPTPVGPPASVPAVTIEVIEQPVSGPVGELLTDSVVVQLKNPDGSVAPNERVNFSTANGGIVANAVDTSDANGIATSGKWRLGHVAGPQRLVISAAAINTSVNVTAEAVALGTVNPPAGMEGRTFVAGVATPQEPIFVAVDSFNNRIAAGTDVTFTALEGTLAASPVTVQTDELGNASPGPWTLSNLIGPQRIRADYEVDGVPTSTILTVQAGCSSTQLGPSSNAQGQWRSSDCRTTTQRIQQYTLTAPPVGNIPVISGFSLSLQGAAGQAVQLLSNGNPVQLTVPTYLYSTSSNPYQVNYILPPGNYDARALSPSLADGFFTLTRSGDLDVNGDFFGSALTYPTMFPVGCGQAGDVTWFTSPGVISYGYLDAPNNCSVGGFGAYQDRYLVQLEAGDTLNPTIVNQAAVSADGSALNLSIRNASTAAGPVLATGVVSGGGTSNYGNPDFGTASNASISFIGNIAGVNGFVAPSTGLYEVIVGAPAAGEFYQLFLAPPISITSTSLPNATVGTAYSAGLAALGGAGTQNWSVAAGALPAKFAMAAAGTISGSPETAAIGTYTITASVFAGSIAQKVFTLTVVDSLPTPP